MYNKFAKFSDDYLAKAQALPKNDNADGNGGVFKLAGQLASTELIVRVNSDITLADTKAITIKLQDSADNSTFADVATIYTKTASGATSIAAETILARFVVPTNIRKYAKVNIATTDGDAAGKLDIFQNYLAR